MVKSYYTTELESESKTIDMLGDEKYCKMIVCAELNRRGITYAWLISEICELKNVTLGMLMLSQRGRGTNASYYRLCALFGFN